MQVEDFGSLFPSRQTSEVWMQVEDFGSLFPSRQTSEVWVQIEDFGSLFPSVRLPKSGCRLKTSEVSFRPSDFGSLASAHANTSSTGFPLPSSVTKNGRSSTVCE